MSRPTIETSTLGGTWIGRRPIRDIGGLPDVGQDFTTELGLVSLSAGHDSLAGADDDEAESPEHPGDLGLARINAQTWLADALQPRNDGGLAIDVLQRDTQHRSWAFLLLANFGDEALLQKDSGNLPLGSRGRDDNFRVPRPRRVADASQHVRNRIGDVHRYLPARLGDAGQLTEQRPLAEADPAQTKAPHECAGTAANEAAMVGLNLVMRRPLRLGDHRLLSHCFSSPRLDGKGHAEEFEQTLRFLVGLRRRHDADFQPAETVNLVVFDLREGELLAQSQRVVAAPVERLRRDPMEVAYAGQCEPREPLEKVPHAVAAQGNANTDRVSFAQSELRNRALRLGGHRLLTGDRGDVAHGGVHGLGICERFAETDVDDDLGQPRGLQLIGVAELLLQSGHRLFFVALLKGSAHAPASSCSRQWPQTRTLWPLPRRSCLTRVTRSQRGQTIITLLTSIGIGLSTMPPCWAMLWVFWLMCGRAFWWRLAMLTPEMTIASGRLEAPRHTPAALSLDSRFRRTLSTLPRLPASLPCRTTTVSPVRISGTLLAEAPLA